MRSRRQAKSVKTRRRPRPQGQSLRSLVGIRIYSVWVEMLQRLVPEGRTHRLAPLVAGMLQYAADLAYEKFGDDAPEGSVAASLLASREGDDPERSLSEVSDLVVQLFRDAGVPYGRTSRRGEHYRVSEEAAAEFVHWYSMPWE